MITSRYQTASHGPDSGSDIAFQSATRLHIHATDSPDSPILETFYAGYDRAFVLANEKEELSGFRECLALNHGAAYENLARQYGPFREIVAIAQDPESGRCIAGANLIAFPARPHTGAQTLRATINLNYVFVAPEARGQGHLRRMATAVSEIASAWLFNDATAYQPPAHHDTLVFIEQNDPLRISRADAEKDTAHSGIGQFDRIRIWTALGARIIDFPYVQPPLSAQQSADDSLLLSVYGALPPRLDACDFQHHLERFFAISVLKGRDLMQEPVAASQVRLLEAACQDRRPFALLDPSTALDEAEHAYAKNNAAIGSLREFLRPEV
ncbi:hypothetical protein APY04_0291 [Hyphomicrobium sulfonivorans]|uniref:Uncharacterized protein n=1 Tax=Hyphomicrobium sulfonivorans TaxID=121290 RepID=A0A109BND1_HYPSL|nr:hypothetical protein [Hyphomicrobium sulfonivorans]KWT72008.1 hypothetical protein APY04_0291 [Hyphomicrobium sulfonivorans]